MPSGWAQQGVHIFTWKPDPDSDTPYYLQIADHIRTLILRRYLNSGDRLSERHIAEQTGVSRSTVTRAFNMLREHGLLDSGERYATQVTKEAAVISHSNTDWQKIMSRSSLKEAHFHTRQMLQKNIDYNTRFANMLAFNNREFKALDFFDDVLKSVSFSDLERIFYNQSAQGLPELREEIAALLLAREINTTPSNIIVFSSYKNALSCVASSLLTGNSVVFHHEQNYYEDFTILSHTNVEHCRIKADRDGIIPLELQAQLKAHALKSRVLYLEPVNQLPTGSTMPRKRIEEIIHICEMEKVPIVEVDYLRDITTFEPPRPAFSSNNGSVIYIGGPGVFCEIGPRFAWVVVPDNIMYDFTNYKYSVYGGNSVWEIFAWRMLKDGKYANYLSYVRETCEKRNRIINTALEKHLGGRALWERNASVFKLVTFNSGVRIDDRVFGKYEILSNTQYLNSSGRQIVIEIVSKTAYDISEIIADIGLNYIS